MYLRHASQKKELLICQINGCPTSIKHILFTGYKVTHESQKNITHLYYSHYEDFYKNKIHQIYY